MKKAIAIVAAGTFALCGLCASPALAQQGSAGRSTPKGETQAPLPKATPLPPGPHTEPAPAETQPEAEMAPGDDQTCPDQGRKLQLIV